MHMLHMRIIMPAEKRLNMNGTPFSKNDWIISAYSADVKRKNQLRFFRTCLRLRRRMRRSASRK